MEAATRKSIKALVESRQQLHQRAQLQDAISGGDIGPQLLSVLKRLGAYKRSDGTPDITYDVATINEKVDEVNEPFLYDSIRQSVTMYYPVVHSILQDLESSGEIDTELIRHDIKGDFLRLREQPRDKIFSTIASKIHKATQAQMQLCFVIGSYFVQSCDIFSKDPTLVGGTSAAT